MAAVEEVGAVSMEASVVDAAAAEVSVADEAVVEISVEVDEVAEALAEEEEVVAVMPTWSSAVMIGRANRVETTTSPSDKHATSVVLPRKEAEEVVVRCAAAGEVLVETDISHTKKLMSPIVL